MNNTKLKISGKIIFLVLSFSLSMIFIINASYACSSIYNRRCTGFECDCWGFEFQWSIGNPVKACGLGSYDSCSPCCSGGRYSCGTSDDKCGSCTDGAQCVIKGGDVCDWGTTGKWDASEGKCVQCVNNAENLTYATKSTIYTTGNGISGAVTGNKKCESGCSSSVGACDEHCPQVLLSSTTYCSGGCLQRDCSNTWRCVKVTEWSDGWCTGGGSVGSDVTCTYDGSTWAWRGTLPAEHCTDGVDNDCDTLVDGNDPDCDTSCGTNSDCNSGYCCTKDTGLPSGCRESIGRCVSTISRFCSNNYICA